MRVVISGATGMLGHEVVTALTRRGDQVVALSRDADSARERLGSSVEIVTWTRPKEEIAPAKALTGADAVVHLLGEPVAQRWSDAAKREIRESRVLGTRNLVAGMRSAADGPGVLVSQSASGYYGPRGSEPVDESEPAGGDFLAEVCAAWEAAARVAEDTGVRVVRPRAGVVLSESGGALEKMLPPFRLGIGGPVAGGRQYVPWIHADDVVGGLIHCLDRPEASGPVNLSAPAPATNAELSKALGRVLRRPAVAPVPGFAVKALYGEMAQIVTTGVRMVPARLEALGYAFVRPDLEDALRAATGTDDG